MPITFSQDNTTQADNTINSSSFYSTIGTPNIKLLSASGIYNPSDNEIRIFNNSTDSIIITSGNNVGIAKTNPSYKLDVNGNIGATNFYGGGANITNVNYNNLTNKPTNFQSDWNSTIINKPTNFQSDWNSTIINKPSLTDFVNSNVLSDVLYNYAIDNGLNGVSSNVLTNIISFYISSNALMGYKYINSNVLSDVLANYNSTNNNSISSNVFGDIIVPYISSNILTNVLANYSSTNNNYISSNVIGNIIVPYISSNILTNVINSYISSNALLGYKYINSNVLSDVLANYPSSNILNNVISPYISSNVLNNVLFNNIDNNSISSNIFFIYSEEKQYPPVATSTYRSVSSQTTVDAIGKTGIRYQFIDLSMNTEDPQSITYGNGRYNIYSSSSYITDTKDFLFNYSTTEVTSRWNLTYSTSTGLFTTNTTTYLVNDSCIGEWIVLELPEAISLTKLRFQTTSSIVNRAPSLWNTYGSNDGLNWSLISEASNQSTALIVDDYINYEYERLIVETTTPVYKFFGICVNKIIAGLASATRLNFTELTFYGKTKNFIDNIPFNLINSNVLINHITNYNLTSSFLSSEKQYPPKAYNSFTTETTTTFLNKTVNYQTFTLNTTGITYGSGTYEIYSSLDNGVSTDKKNVLFNDNKTDYGTIWDVQYNDTNGSYIGNDFIVAGYSGDWIIIKLPEVISLSKFTFYIDSSSYNYAPALWKCYGSNDGITFTEIPDGSISSQLITTDYMNNYYTKIITSPTPLYRYIGFTFNKIVGGNFANLLSMTEIYLFGKTLLPSPFNLINSNVLSDVLTPHITSNALLGYTYINSNILTNILSPYVSSNVLTNIISYYPSSNVINNVLSNYDNNQSSSFLSSEREYPPKAYNSTTSETTTNFLNKTVFYLTLTLNSSGITYGSGDYIIYSSSRNNDNLYRKDVFFNYDINGFGAIWQSEFYNYYSGDYLGSNFIVSGYTGEWIIIKLPNAISLTKYVFYTEAYSNPTLWKCYGSNDGITFVEIPDGSISSILTNSDYTNNTYTKTITSKTPFYKYIGFTFNKIITTNAETVGFKEIRLFGKEFLFNDLNPPFNLINSNVISLYPSSNVITNVLSPYFSSNVFINVIANQQINFNNITNKPTYYSSDWNSTISNKPTIINSQWTSGTSLIYITGTTVGIGLTNPLLSRALDVNGVIGTNSSVGCSFLQVSANSVSRSGTYANLVTYNSQLYLVNDPFTQTNVCADFGSAIFVQGNIVISSDERIKQNIVDINDDTALQKILSIQPKIYNYIDYKKKGTSNIYGFIAQQIKEVIPEAITLQTNYIPNIYDLGFYSNNTITTSNVNISNIIDTSNIVKIIDNYGYEYKCNITSVISSNSFTIDKDINTSNVFIYGKEIDDFHSLDKSYIYTLNVCATQEINRKLDLAIQRIEYLENYINSNI